MSQMPGQFPAGGGAMAPPPKKSNTVLWVLLGIGGLFLCGCGGCIAMIAIPAIMFGPQTVMLGLEIEKGRNHPVVIEKVGHLGTQGQPVGQPIMTSTQMKMEQRMTGDKGSANFAIDLQKQGGDWTVVSSQVKFDDGSVLDLKTNQVSGGTGAAVPDAMDTEPADGSETESDADADSEK